MPRRVRERAGGRLDVGEVDEHLHVHHVVRVAVPELCLDRRALRRLREPEVERAQRAAELEIAVGDRERVADEARAARTGGPANTSPVASFVRNVAFDPAAASTFSRGRSYSLWASRAASWKIASSPNTVAASVISTPSRRRLSTSCATAGSEPSYARSLVLPLPGRECGCVVERRSSREPVAESGADRHRGDGTAPRAPGPATLGRCAWASCSRACRTPDTAAARSQPGRSSGSLLDAGHQVTTFPVIGLRRPSLASRSASASSSGSARPSCRSARGDCGAPGRFEGLIDPPDDLLFPSIAQAPIRPRRRRGGRDRRRARLHDRGVAAATQLTVPTVGADERPAGAEPLDSPPLRADVVGPRSAPHDRPTPRARVSPQGRRPPARVASPLPVGRDVRRAPRRVGARARCPRVVRALADRRPGRAGLGAAARGDGALRAFRGS